MPSVQQDTEGDAGGLVPLDTTPMRRCPLAPIRIDTYRSEIALSTYPRSYSDDDERPSIYQRRKLSVPISLSITRPPHARRRSRHSPMVSASLTPNRQYNGSQRRTSLPALHFHETNVTTLHLDTRKHGSSIPEDLYRAIQTFSFGDPPSHVSHSVADGESSGEDERLRDVRATKRRATDETRRASLTTNAETPVATRPPSSISTSSAESISVYEVQMDGRTESHWDEIDSPSWPRPPSNTDDTSVHSEPRLPPHNTAAVARRRSRSADDLGVCDEWMGDTTPTPTQTCFPTAPPLLPWSDNSHSMDPYPKSSQALDGFDLAYITGIHSSPGDIITPRAMQDPLPHNADFVKHTTSAPSDSTPPSQPFASGIFNKWRKVKPPPSRPEDDSFFIQNVYNEGNSWTFRRESRPEIIPVKGKEGSAVRVAEEPEGWWFLSGATPYFNRLQICQYSDPANGGNELGGPPVVVHRHSQVQGFSIYRCHSVHLRQPTMDPVDSILLASKAVLRQYTRTQSTRALKTHGLIDDGEKRTASLSHRPPPSERSSKHDVTDAVVIGGVGRSRGSHTEAPVARRNVSRPTTASTTTTTTHPPSLTELSKTLSYTSVVSSTELLMDPPSPRSTRVSTTSHAEAFAMIGDTSNIPSLSGPLHSSSATHNQQRRPFGWLKAFSGKQGSGNQKDTSPVTEEEGDFVAPWLRVAPRAERAEAERQVKQVSHSFECVGLIPPHEKRSSKSRSRNSTNTEECAALRQVPDNCVCMILPLWPEPAVVSTVSRSRSTRRSSSSTRAASGGVRQTRPNPTVPLEARRFLLVWYVPLDTKNQKRRRPGTADEPRHANYNQGFCAYAQLLTYEDLRSSNIRLPEKGLCVNDVNPEMPGAMTMDVPEGKQMMAVVTLKSGVIMVHDGLAAFSFVGQDSITEMGKAIAEMIWTGCMTLMTFMS
ncbi:hypothetical protein BU17DRAFT_65480 [Hysterangium stoloniferum]|nr:hypothetical protein BU17DRAFT_65480 [Hysterangium stoloniferum]